MNPYHEFAASFARLAVAGKSLPLGGLTPPPRPQPAANAPKALIFSPHPDDECITGGLALRLMREARWRVVNVAVTLGSNPERRPERWRELTNACDWIGFELEATAANGLENINPAARANDPQHWAGAMNTIAASLAKHRPRVIFFPHELDCHSTHVGTHCLVMDALKNLPADFECVLVENEFWGQMPAPNLMVESSVADVGELLAALSCHAGELRRNPFHLRLPAWLQDNVRRGAELVGGQGGVAPDFQFATLYRLRQWKDGRVQNVFSGGRQIGVKDDPTLAWLC